MKNNQGYIRVPYITMSSIQVVDSSFKKSIYTIVNNSFYGHLIDKRTIRKNKIENIFKLKNPTEQFFI